MDEDKHVRGDGDVNPDVGHDAARVLNGFAVGAGAKGLLAGVAAVDCVPRSRAFSSFNRSTSSTSDVTWVMSVCTRAWSPHATEPSGSPGPWTQQQ